MYEFEGDPDDLEDALKSRYANTDHIYEVMKSLLIPCKHKLVRSMPEGDVTVTVWICRDAREEGLDVYATDWDTGEQHEPEAVREILPLGSLRTVGQAWSDNHAPVLECVTIKATGGELFCSAQFA